MKFQYSDGLTYQQQKQTYHLMGQLEGAKNIHLLFHIPLAYIGNLRSKGPRKELLQQIYKKGRSYMYLALIRYVCNTLFYLFILEAAVQHTSILYKQRLDTLTSFSLQMTSPILYNTTQLTLVYNWHCCCQLAV